MQTVDALTVSIVVDNSSDMLSTRPPHIASELRVLMSFSINSWTGRTCFLLGVYDLIEKSAILALGEWSNEQSTIYLKNTIPVSI